MVKETKIKILYGFTIKSKIRFLINLVNGINYIISFYFNVPQKIKFLVTLSLKPFYSRFTIS